ncbi:MAG TPA: ferritin-like domain-containing protein [Allosphingosinicella sp.]|nr:ferritin-like domain-containing protein [Allosphingosinicella sp.]
MTRTLSASAQAARPASSRPTDLAALKAIAQAAIDVELFTIPLYMTSLYSIYGMHEINGANNKLYLGRLWPGSKASAAPAGANEQAFNIVFSVFIQEMLHLQMAANMASVVGAKPDFTSAALQDERHGWTCYGPDKTIIPNIIDLKDTILQGVAVNTGPLDAERIKLFLAIEAPEEVAKKAIKQGKYFPKAPFDGWKPGDPLPMFGTIGWMYQCYYDYLSLSYDKGPTLWETVWKQASKGTPVQNDLFNAASGGHPMREFMGFNTIIALTYPDIAYQQMVAMMDAITDQGEGSILKRDPQLLAAVMPKYVPEKDALESDYPSFDAKGQLAASGDAAARFGNDHEDHYERFQEVQKLIEAGSITTWANNPKVGHWQASDLKTADYDENPYIEVLPSADDIAGALNRLSQQGDSHKLLSQAAIGAIAGVTTVLNDYWAPAAGAKVLFPYPSMAGSGDRMAIAWAVTGISPDLSLGIDPPVPDTLKHACQGLDFEDGGKNDCAQVAIFHSCKGSNHCRAQGGCGFVQVTTGGGNCSGSAPASGGGSCGGGGGNCGSVLSTRMFGGTCGFPPPPPSTFYSAPSDNKCASLGGCAVPISASQLYPTHGVMQLFDFEPDETTKSFTSDPICRMRYDVGDAVHDVAYKAFAEVMNYKQKPPEPKPKPNDLRLAFPPST